MLEAGLKRKQASKPPMTMEEAKVVLKVLPSEEFEAMIEALDATRPRYRRLYVDCALGKAGKRGIIRMMCLTCGEQTVEEVRECSVLTCPLRRYRPYQAKGVGA